MNTMLRATAFGCGSGLIWSLAPGILGDFFDGHHSLFKIVFASVLTGVATSIIFGYLVTRVGFIAASLLGCVSLPVGAFLFGVAFRGLREFEPAIRNGFTSVDGILATGISYAFFSVVSYFSVVLIPLAIATTLALRVFLLRAPKFKTVA